MNRPSKSALAIRMDLGLSQKELAEFLGTNRVVLARFEAGVSSLSRPARDRMLDLLSLWKVGKSTNPDSQPTPGLNDRSIVRLKRQLRKELHLLENAKFELSQSEVRFLQSSTWYARLGAIQPQTERERRWIARVRRRHEWDMKTFGPSAQADIRLRIAGYEGRIWLLNELLLNGE